MSFSPSVMLENLDKALEEDNIVTQYLNKLEKKTNIKKRYFVIVFGTFLSIYLVYGYAADLLCNVIGFVYPAYISVKAIESVSKDDDTEWLMYWVVFATFSLVEFFSDILLSWFPFYFLGKCVFLLWCMSSVSWNGKKILYKKFIRPWVLTNEMTIDKVLSSVNVGAKELMSNAASEASKVSSSDMGKDIIGKAAASMFSSQTGSPDSTENIEPNEDVPESTLTLRKDAAKNEDSDINEEGEAAFGEGLSKKDE